MDVVRRAAVMQRRSLAERGRGRTIGFVPTMGYLHAGHASLMELLRPGCDLLVASIFVNPAQFNDPADLAKYPVDIPGDLARCERAGVDLVFLPQARDIYPPGFTTWVEETSLSLPLCGAARPGHFRGVTTVVAKLCNIVQPDLAAFGQKDFQQLLVIERMVRDLNLPVRIVRGPTVREPDGLAMSSRNARLTPAGRAVAPGLYRALQAAGRLHRRGERRAERLVAAVAGGVARSMPGAAVDYIELRDTRRLRTVRTLAGPGLLAAAVWLDRVRLIDNLLLE